MGHYKGEVFLHSKALVISEWTQIIATFSHFRLKNANQLWFRFSIIVNGEEESLQKKSSSSQYLSPPTISNAADAEIIIGGLDSFRGSIGLVDIFTLGAAVQTGKYYLIFYFNFYS